MEEPPSFQEAAQCVVCNVSFTTFKRRHHCRACGRSFCNEHSANQKALPQHGLYSAVRVCDECFSPPKLSVPNIRVSHSTAIESSTTNLSKLDLEGDSYISSKEGDRTLVPPKASFDCTCGMPLCICEAPSTSEVSTSTAKLLAPQKAREARKASSSTPSGIKMPTVVSSGRSMPRKSSQGNSHPLSKLYELTGEGIREAVKNGDVSAVRELLSQGVDVNYIDRQGMSLLHLATMFNFTEITFILMDSGGNLHAKNAQGRHHLIVLKPP